MSRKQRWSSLAFGAVLLSFGLGCLNYTRADTIEYHRGWAAENGLPAPGTNILLIGAGAIVLGSGTFGFAVGRRGG